MDRSTPIELIAQTREKDAYGVERVTGETSRTVFARVQSTYLKEFHEAFRNGLNPEFVFTMFRYDYRGESVVKHNGERYYIYRKGGKESSDSIELYAGRKGGTNRGNVD